MRNICLKSKDLQYRNVSGIIFDKDGTLTDSHFYWSEIIRRRTLALQKEYNIESNFFSSIATAMGLNVKTNTLMIDGPIAIKSRQEVIESVVNKFVELKYDLTTKDISDVFRKVHREFKDSNLDYVKPIPEACNFVKSCHTQNLKLALITSDTRTNAEIAIKKLGLDKIFQLIIGVEDGFGSKSIGIPAKYACERMGLSSNNVIAIGDAPMDYQMSMNSQLLGSILVETGQIPIKDLLKLTPYCVKNLSEISFN